jgi:hypothetical protein
VPYLLNGDETVRLLTSSVGLLALLLFVPGGLSDLAYRGRDAYLRWVAARHKIHVPSLVADSLVTGDEIDDQPIEHAVHHPEPIEVLELLGCPVCGARIPVDEARYHPHFAVEPTLETL